MPLPACEMDLLLGVGFGWFLLGLHRAHGVLSPGCCCLPGLGVGHRSLKLFSDPASWQEGSNEASPTPGSWKNRRRPEDSALMSSGSSREGSSKVQEPFWLFWALLGPERSLCLNLNTPTCAEVLLFTDGKHNSSRQLELSAFCICRSRIVLAMFLTGCNFLN